MHPRASARVAPDVERERLCRSTSSRCSRAPAAACPGCRRGSCDRRSARRTGRPECTARLRRSASAAARRFPSASPAARAGIRGGSSRAPRRTASRTSSCRRTALGVGVLDSGLFIARPPPHVWKMFHAPGFLSGGSLIWRRALCVPQSIACRSTFMPISRSFCAVTTACACARCASTGSRITTFSPL